MTDEIFDPLPGDGYDEPVNSQGEPLRDTKVWDAEKGELRITTERKPTHKPKDDVGPPAPGEWNEKDYPNPEIGMKC